MGVILIDKNNPRERLYLENLGTHAGVVEELSYLILKYPPLFLEGFVGEASFAFVGQGVLQPVLAQELRNYRGGNTQSEGILTRFLARNGYTSPGQQSMFLRDAKEYLALPRGRIELERGDLFFSLQKYGKAVDAHERAFADDKLDRTTRSHPLGRESAAPADLFLSEHAFDCFQETYALEQDRNTVKRMYFLTETETDETLGACFRRKLPEVRDGEKARQEEQLHEVTSRDATGKETKEVTDIFAEQDEIKHHAREEKVIAQWREEYRNMV